jgi:hypothetical protein
MKLITRLRPPTASRTSLVIAMLLSIGAGACGLPEGEEAGTTAVDTQAAAVAVTATSTPAGMPDTSGMNSAQLEQMLAGAPPEQVPYLETQLRLAREAELAAAAQAALDRFNNLPDYLNGRE